MSQDKGGTTSADSQWVRGRGEAQRLHSRLGSLKTQVRTTVFLEIPQSPKPLRYVVINMTSFKAKVYKVVTQLYLDNPGAGT